jgi:cell division protein FtsZ
VEFVPLLEGIIKYSLEEYMELDDDFKVLNQLQKAQEVVPAE